MRFGRTLEKSIYPPWRDNYINYGKLKKLLREDDSANSSPDRQASDRWTEDDEGAFVDELVNNQLEQVHAFHKDTYEKLTDRTAKCEARLDSIAILDKGPSEDKQQNGEGSNGKKPVPSEEERKNILKEVLGQLDEITKETNELEKYARINYAGFLKAAKKHDRKRGHAYRVRPLLQVRLAALPFNKEDYNPLLYRLSAMYSFVRQHLEGVEPHRGPSMSENGPGKEEYTSHKFWVHPENLLEVKTVILRRLPVLVYNPQTSKIAEGTQPDPSITSIYFDNPAFNLYSNKVDHGEASSLRMRWYGQLNSKPEIFVEKKTVGEDDTSHEDRFKTKEKYVQRFIQGEYKMEKQIQKLSNQAGADSNEAKQFKEAVDEIQSFIQTNDLQPVLRANYTRTAFQVPGDSRIRISLDTDLAFIREDAIDSGRPCRDPESWHRTDIDNNELSYPFSSIRKGEVSRFPFALLEIKIRSSDRKRLEWVQDLMNSHLVKDAPRFSKFVHGVANLFEDYVNTFPFWLSEMETDIRRDPQQAFEEEQAKKRKERDDEFAVGSLLKSRPSQSFGGGNAIVSPVGSPSASTIKAKSPDERRKSTLAMATSHSSSQVPTQNNETVEEADEDETGIRTYGTTDQQQQSASSRLVDLFPSFSTSKYANARRSAKLPPGVQEPSQWIKDQGPVKVEAKVWLANQRTFIKWQHVSVLLGSLGLGLYNAAGVDNNIARSLALVYTLVAVFTGAWGYGIYMWRQSLIFKRSGRDFDAITGPIVVCVGLIVALLLNFAFKYRAAMEHREHGHHGHHDSSFNQTQMLPHDGDLKVF
ncbi:hypothetical protein WHR41_06947 [Cladosporium halotolerans]|uniref:SPX domain-containing protein n=1 Tax=Cladosporium halotolerans TaxID=1052096 RepID=A0AB34KI31_9PEZI